MCAATPVEPTCFITRVSLIAPHRTTSYESDDLSLNAWTLLPEIVSYFAW
jgi:hypothetical protein